MTTELETLATGLGYLEAPRVDDDDNLYFSDVIVGIWAYDIASDGTFATRRLLAYLPDCDGMAVDSEEGIWVACYSSGEFVRLKADGSVDRKVPVPVKQVLRVTFGGRDLRDLYIVTASDYWDRSTQTGTIIRMRSDIPGLRTPRTNF